LLGVSVTVVLADWPGATVPDAVDKPIVKLGGGVIV
jgi:hypothetical protein